MTQVYSFIDANGETRLLAQISPAPGGGPAAGTYVPVANATGVTVDTTTYDDPIAGGGAKLTTLVFPITGQGALAYAFAGDAHPRAIFPSDPTDILVGFGDGTIDPYSSGQRVAIAGTNGVVPRLQLPNVSVNSAATPGDVPTLSQVSPLFSITSGALATVQLSTGSAAQFATTRDVETHTPVTFNPGAATIATCRVSLSPDNVTASVLAVWTEPVGVALDGTIHDVTCRVPAGWWLKLDVAQATIGLTTYF